MGGKGELTGAAMSSTTVDRTLPKLSPARNTTYGDGDGMDSPASRRASISVTLSNPLISSDPSSPLAPLEPPGAAANADADDEDGVDGTDADAVELAVVVDVAAAFAAAAAAAAAFPLGGGLLSCG